MSALVVVCVCICEWRVLAFFLFCVLDFPIYSILLSLPLYSIKLHYLFGCYKFVSILTVVVLWERERALTSSRARQLSSALGWELVGLSLALLHWLACAVSGDSGVLMNWR